MKSKLLCILFALSGLTVLSQTQIPSYVPTNNLQAWYPFNGNANDESGNGHNGDTLNVTLTTDRCGNHDSAFYFNGINSYINIPDSFFNVGWTSYTVAFWLNSDSVLNPVAGNRDQAMFNTNPHYGMEIAYDWGGANLKYDFFANYNPGTIAGWGIFGNDQALSTTNVTAHVWNHLVIVKDSLTYYMYLNGVLNATFTTTIPTVSYNCGLVLGNITQSNEWEPETFWGSLDDYGIWNRALSAAEILTLYQGSCNTPACNLSATITAGGPTNFCRGGSVTLDAGAGYSSYLWNNGSSTETITVSGSGSFNCRVTQGDCNATSDTIVVTVNNNPAPAIRADGPTTFCKGVFVTLDAGAGYSSYLWSDNETTETIIASSPGSYSCSVTQGNCSGNSDTVVVTVINPPQPDITPAGPITICAGASVTLDAGAGYTSYLWSNKATTEKIIVTSEGSYTCTVTQDGCSGTSKVVVVNISSTPPNAICKNTTVTLVDGTASITPANVDGGSTADCGIASETVSPSTFTAANIGPNTVILTVTDSSGNIATCNAVVTVISTQSDTGFNWTKKACLPAEGRDGIANFSIGNKAYVVCGITAASPAISEVWEYDQPTNTWTQKNNFAGGARAIPTSFVIDSVAYVGLGLDNDGNYHSDFWKYNQATDSWTQVASFPGAARYTAMAFAANGNGYVGCGKGSGTYNDFYAYDPVANSWSAIASFPGGDRQTGFGLGINNIGYVGLGYVGGTFFTDMYSYNPSTNNWTTLASYPGGVIDALTGFAINGILYTAAGRNSNTFFSECWGYNPSTNTWTQQQGFSCIAPPRSTWEGFSINGHGYVACGGDNTNMYNDLLEFGPDDTTFTTRAHVLGDDTSYCGAFSQTLTSGASCALWSNGVQAAQITVTTPGTYWVRFADSCGMSSDTIHIGQGSNITDSITPAGPITICQGASITLDAGKGYSSYLWSNNATTETITVTSTGSYSSTVTKGSCTGISNTVAVTVSDIFAPIIKVSGPTSFCQGDSVTLDAGGGFSSYLWSNGSTTEDITVYQNGSYTCTVTQGSCSAVSNTVVVTVNEILAPIIKVSGPTSFCQGDSVTLDAGSGFSSYLWSNGATSESITVYQSGSYTCTVGQGGCSAVSNTVIVTINEILAPIIKVSGPTSFCQGNSVTLDAGSGFSSYLWNNGATTESITVYQSGSYTCTVGEGSCAAVSNTVIVTVNEILAPIIKVSGPTSFCQGDSVTLDAGSGFSSYLWNNGATTESITVYQSGSYTCTVGQGACSAVSSTVIVAVNEILAPIIKVSGPTSFCQGDSVTLDAGSGFSSYLWSNGATNESITVSENGTYTCTVSQGACSAVSNSVVVTVNSVPRPVITPAGPITICQGSSITLNAGAGYSSYSWSNKATTQSITVTQAGQYICTVTLNGCSGVSNEVTVNISTTPPNAVCKNDTVILVDGRASITPSDVDGGSTAPCGIASETVSPSGFTIADTGVNTVVLTVTDSSGHSSTCDAKVIVVYKSTCIPFTCSIASVPQECGEHSDGNPYIIYLGYCPRATKLSVSVTGSGPYTYAWSPSDFLSCNDCADPIFTPVAQGNYTFEVTVSSGRGCTSTCNITICVLDIRVPIDSGWHQHFRSGFGHYDFDQVYVCQKFGGRYPFEFTIAVDVDFVAELLRLFPEDHLGRCDQTCDGNRRYDDLAGESGDNSNVAEFIPGNENGSGFNLMVYPNPFSSEFHLRISSASTEQINIRMLDITGRVVLEQEGVETDNDLLMGGNLSKGLYLVEVTQGSSKKVLKITKAE